MHGICDGRDISDTCEGACTRMCMSLNSVYTSESTSQELSPTQIIQVLNYNRAGI